MSVYVPSVTELVADRINSNTLPGERGDDDRYKLGIIIQGGAMRGVIGAGASIALQSLFGETEPVDMYPATSAGAFSVAGLESRNGVDSASIYYEELSKGFISIRNRFRIGKIIDLGILMKAINEGEKAFDFERILNHPAETSFYASSVQDAEPVEFRMGRKALQSGISETDKGKQIIICRTPADVATALEATAHIPYFAGPPVKLPDGRLLIDGGVTAGRIPLMQAIEAGCTHILVIATDRNVAPEEYGRRKSERIGAWAIRRRYPELAKRYWQGHDRHKDVLSMLRAAEAGELPPRSPRIEVIRPNERFIPSTTEVDPHKIYIAAKAGEQAVLAAFAPYGIDRNKDITVRMPR